MERRHRNVLVAIGALLRVCGLWFGLPNIHARPDEIEAIANGIRIVHGDLNPHFFHWPSLHLYVLAAIYAVAVPLYRLAGLAENTLTFAHYAIPGRAYVAAAGTLTIIALYRLARQVTGSSAALVAALFLAVAPLHVRDSHFAMTDVTMTLLVTVSVPAGETVRRHYAREPFSRLRPAGRVLSAADELRQRAEAGTEHLDLRAPGQGRLRQVTWRVDE